MWKSYVNTSPHDISAPFKCKADTNNEHPRLNAHTRSTTQQQNKHFTALKNTHSVAVGDDFTREDATDADISSHAPITAESANNFELTAADVRTL